MNAPPPRDMNDIDPRPTAAIEAEIAKDAAALEAKVAAKDWPGDDKQSFLDMLLGKDKK